MVGEISADGSSWSGTWKDSHGVGGTWEGTRGDVVAENLVGRWTLTSTCARGCPGAGELTQDLQIESQNVKTGVFKGTLDEAEITGYMASSGQGRTIRFAMDDADDEGYRASWTGAKLNTDFTEMSGGTWTDSKSRTGSWKATRWSGVFGKALPKDGVKPGIGPNPISTCVGSTPAACTGFGGLAPSELQACLSYWSVCQDFGGSKANLVQGCVGSVLGACLGFGGMTHDDIQVCVASVSACEGFGGMTPPLTQTCVSTWGTCTGFGGMTPPQIQTCVANVAGACTGFGPSTEAQLRACIANQVALCQGFGLDQASATSTKKVKPKAFDPWKLDCGSGAQLGGFLFDGVECEEEEVVETLSSLDPGARSASPFPAKKKRGLTAAAAGKPMVLARMQARIGAGRALVGRLAVTDTKAQAFLARSKGRHVKLRYWLRLTILRHGKPVKQPRVFSKTVDAVVAG
jgi:hypothetical protein